MGKLSGGLAEKKKMKPSDFDPIDLMEGILVELEHTDDYEIALTIAMDHLTEDPLYYKKLKKIEKKSFDFDELFKARKKPYGHEGYIKRTKSGKLVRIGKKGVKPMEPKPKGKQAPMSSDILKKINPKTWMGRQFQATELPKDVEMNQFAKVLGIDLERWLPPAATKEKTQFDLTGDLNSHWIMNSTYPTKSMRTKEMQEAISHHHYTRGYRQRSNTAKFIRAQKLDPLFDDASDTFHDIMSDESRPLMTREAAAMLFIASKRGFRHGEMVRFKKTGVRGVATLSSGNVDITDDRCSFRFMGKKDTVNTGSIIDAGLAKFLSECKQRAGKKFLWQNPDNSHLDKVKEEVGVGGFKIHDFRTLLACRWATLEFARTKVRFPKGDIERAHKVLWKKIRDAAGVVDKKLCEKTRGTALANYINPAIVDAWIQSVGVAPDSLPAWASTKQKILTEESVEKSLKSDPGWIERFGSLWQKIMQLKIKKPGKIEPSLDESEDDPTEE